jgi:hypothetical protein
LIQDFCFDIIRSSKINLLQNKGDNFMGKFVAIIGGLIAMAGGIYLAIFVWWREFYELVFGTIPPLLLLLGLIALIAGISGLKDKKRIDNIKEEPSETESEE